jgi:hypothetical protein
VLVRSRPEQPVRGGHPGLELSLVFLKNVKTKATENKFLYSVSLPHRELGGFPEVMVKVGFRKDI